jgi:hypothetical protein
MEMEEQWDVETIESNSNRVVVIRGKGGELLTVVCLDGSFIGS